MGKLNRRGFLKSGIAGAAGVIAISPILASEQSAVKEKEILYRTLGRTGIKVSVLGFGAGNANNLALFKAALDNGVNFFDTANCYQNGNNEVLLGNVFKGLPRKSFVIQTKVLLDGMTPEGKPTVKTTAEGFLKNFSASLSKLRLDYTDILLIHNIWEPEVLEYKPILGALRKLKKQGKTKFIGFSVHKNMPALINAAASSDIWDVILTSYNYTLTNIEEMNAAIIKAGDAGIGIVAMKVMAGGGFLDKEKTKPIDALASMKWILSNPYVATSIPGISSFDQLNYNLKILGDINLTEKEKNDLLITKAEPGMCCSGCLNCIPACPNRLPVPDLMRAYMYAYGYSKPSMAYALLGELGTGSSPCSTCESCKVVCSKNFNVKAKISDISRLVDVPSDFIV
jgi:uncharacterized protein